MHEYCVTKPCTAWRVRTDLVKNKTRQTERSGSPGNWTCSLEWKSHEEITSRMMWQNMITAMGHWDLVSWEHIGGRRVKFHRYCKCGELEKMGSWSWALDMWNYPGWIEDPSYQVSVEGSMLKSLISYGLGQVGLGRGGATSPGCLGVISRSLILSPPTSLLSFKTMEILIDSELKTTF